MDVSIIVPIYRGNKYISLIQKMLNENIHFIIKEGRTLQLELIFVNDYPDEPIVCDRSLCDGYTLNIIENSVNSGIHQTRVNGLKKANGEYILFLDQDDEIFADCILSQFELAKDYDIVIGNGYRIGVNGKYRKIYRNRKKQELSCKEKYFIKAANQIVSPGHCLIKRESIPKEWSEYIITDNGADDLFLWLLMFEKKCKFGINQKCVYKHVDTGVNLSNNLDAMYRSSDNLIKLSKECGIISEKNIHIYERLVSFLRQIHGSSKLTKVKACIANVDICIAKLFAYYR